MQSVEVPLVETGQIHALTKDYLLKKDSLKPFYKYTPTLEGIKLAIGDRAKKLINRNLLVDRLKAHYKKIDPDFFADSQNNLVIANIESLISDKTFTVTTGHQLNILGGPLYYIYKIISVIKLAQTLKTEFPGHNFIPVYWMASEDDNLKGVNFFHLWSKTLTWDTEQTGAVGRMQSTGFDNILAEIKEVLPQNENSVSLANLFSEAYDGKRTMAEATTYWVNILFRQFGLVIINPHDVELKKSLIPVFEKEIETNFCAEEVSKTISSLSEYKLPVNPREVNIFYLIDNERKRLIQNRDSFTTSNSDLTWSKEELLSELHSHPERFSPNVIMRTMYQELTLPNVAYIGGNNEIAYWMQLKSAFEVANIFYPVLIVRDSVLWFGKKSMKDIESLKLIPQDILLSKDDILARFYDNNALIHPSSDTIESILSDFEKLRAEIQDLDSSTIAAIVKDLNLSQKEVKKWRSLIKTNVETQEEKNIQKIDKLRNLVFPSGEFQERHDNFMALYSVYGKDLIDSLLEIFDPLKSKLHIVSE